MKQGDNCPICLWLFNKEVKVVVNNRSRNFRFECPEALRHMMEHRFTITGDLFVKNKRLMNHHMCPKCGHVSGLVGGENNFQCHTCNSLFKLDGTEYNPV